MANSVDTDQQSVLGPHCLFVCLFDSLRPLNNLSVMQDGLPGLNQY